MEGESQVGDSLSFMDQCTVICLGYISSRGELEIQSDKAINADELRSLCNIAEQELAEFGDKNELQPFIDASRHLANTYDEGGAEKLAECLENLQSSLDQENFSECADTFIGPPVESWKKVSELLHLIYKACEQHGTAMVGTVIDIGVRYMRKTITDFVTSQGGWRSLAASQSEEKVQGDISASIVVVQQEDSAEVQAESAAGDAQISVKDLGSPSKDANESGNSLDNSALTSPKNRTPVPLSPLDTPPFSIPSSVNTDDDRDSLATPPEMIERPLMTESDLQAMGEQDFRRISSASGNGSGFEIIDSENGGAETQNVTKSIDDAQAFESPSEKGDEESEPSEPEKSQTESGESTPQAVESSEEPLLGGYLPHISIGVAAAAAVAGFFVLKKNM